MSERRFFKQKEDIDEVIKAKYDPVKDWNQDPKGYFLIRIDEKKKLIEAALVNNKHVIKKVIKGKYAVEVYFTIMKRKLVSLLDHAAYLGKELYKAELALKYNKKYKQSFPLEFKEIKDSIKLKKDS